MSSAADEAFLRSLRDGTLPSLSHDAHVRYAWLVLQRAPLLTALEEIRRGLLAFAAAKGKPEVFHETITWAFILLIHERIQRGHGGKDWREFLVQNADLREGLTALHELYDADVLDSELARHTFVLPARPPEPGSQAVA
jgi:hypothetical protein